MQRTKVLMLRMGFSVPDLLSHRNDPVCECVSVLAKSAELLV